MDDFTLSVARLALPCFCIDVTHLDRAVNGLLVSPALRDAVNTGPPYTVSEGLGILPGGGGWRFVSVMFSPLREGE